MLIARTGLENASKQLSEISKTSIVIDKVGKFMETPHINFTYLNWLHIAPYYRQLFADLYLLNIIRLQ